MRCMGGRWNLETRAEWGWDGGLPKALSPQESLNWLSDDFKPRKAGSIGRPPLLVVRPHPEYANNAFFDKDFVDQTVLDIDSP